MTTLPVLNPKAAAVDVGSEQRHVSIAGDAPKVFGSTTAQLQALRDYLLEQGVSSVAMEATGVYGLCLYAGLEQAGLEVVMVNGRHVKNLPGRKTDMKDCQWQATLHAHGLLRGGFVPKEQIRRLQDYQRLRADHITMAAAHQLHMQKALERMNIKFHDVISHLTGVSGLKVIRAILAGERDPAALLALCDPLIQKRKAERVRESLVGTWKEEHLFALRQALAGWEFYQGQIAECDRALEHVLKEIAPGAPGSTRRRLRACPDCCAGCVAAKTQRRFLASLITRCCNWWPRRARTWRNTGGRKNTLPRGWGLRLVVGKAANGAATKNVRAIVRGGFSA